MAPRLSLFKSFLWAVPSTPSKPLTAFLVPSFAQARSASILGSLSDNPGAYNKKIRRGRGPSSGKGKTSGRGHKGQKAHGKVPALMQGGQTPLRVVLGDRGFKNPFSLDISTVNLERIQSWIDQGRIDPSKQITLKELVESRCLHGIKDGVKLLARGKDGLKTPINIMVSRASSAAIKAVEAAGGNIITRYYTRQSIRRLLRGESESSSTPIDVTLESSKSLRSLVSKAGSYKYRLPDPTSRKDLEYYRDKANRGYLSHLVAKGHGPSLFFKTPGFRIERKTKAVSEKPVVSKENILW